MSSRHRLVTERSSAIVSAETEPDGSMRILMVTDFYHPYNGGVEIHVKTVAEALAARGHEVAVATMPTGDHQQPRNGEGPVQVFPVEHLIARLGRGFTNANRPWAPPFPDPLTMTGLRRVVRSFAPDVIHGHDWLSRSVLPRVVSGSIPVVTSLHYYTRTCAKKTLWYDGGHCPGPSLNRCLRCAADHYGSAKGAVVTLGLRAGARIEDRRSAAYVSVSEATANGNALSPAGPLRSVVVPNPLTDKTLEAENGQASSELTELPESIPDGPFLAFVGDLRPEKGVHVLLEAVDHLRQQHGNAIPLVLVGERTTDGLALPANTIEVGLVPHETVQAIWRRATIGVVPSLWPEPFGLVATEAMAAGCPLVASAVGGLVEILGPEQPDDPTSGRGVLVPPGDPVALAAAIDELSADPDRRARLADAARRSLVRYDLDQVVDAIEGEYRSAIAGAAV